MDDLKKLVEDNKTYSAEEIAKSLKMSKDNVYKLVRNGKLKSKFVNNKIRFTIEFIQEYLRGKNGNS